MAKRKVPPIYARWRVRKPSGMTNDFLAVILSEQCWAEASSQYSMRLTAIIVLIPALFAVGHAQKFRFAPLKQNVLQQRMDPAPRSLQEREARIRQLFLQSGCTADKITEQALENAAGANVICRLPGKSTQSIIIGANYSPGILDNWTAASLLPSVFQSLASRKRRHTFIFIAFADGDHDLAGSEFFARQMNESDINRTEAMINLEALGFSPTKISSAASDKKLVGSFVTVMYVLKQMASQVDISTIRLDSEPFASRNIPQITIHSLTQENVAGLQSEEQIVPSGGANFAHLETGFHPSLYYKSYHLISGYLAYLDETLKPRQQKISPARAGNPQPSSRRSTARRDKLLQMYADQKHLAANERE